MHFSVLVVDEHCKHPNPPGGVSPLQIMSCDKVLLVHVRGFQHHWPKSWLKDTAIESLLLGTVSNPSRSKFENGYHPC